MNDAAGRGAVFTRHGGGAMGWWLLIGVIGAFATALAFAPSRMAGSARRERLSAHDLKQLRGGRHPLKRD